MEIGPILSSLRRSKTGAILIAAQVAITLAVLANAVYVVQDRLALSKRPSGAAEADTFVLRLYAFRPPADLEQMQREDVRALQAIPGVSAVAWTNQVPLSNSGWSSGIAAQRTATDTVSTAMYFSPDSLVDALGLTLLEGRDFVADDVVLVDPRRESEQPKVAIVTRSLARWLYPELESVVGQTLSQGTGDSAPEMTIVGVVERLQRPWAPAGSEAELSVIYPQRHLSEVTSYFVRTEPGSRDSVMAAAEAALTSRIDGRMVLFNRGLDEVRSRYYRSHRALAGILVAVCVLLVLVTASGIVGMASLWVNQRRKQIGVRRALGALRRDVIRYFLVENFLVTTVGLVAGVGLALGLNELLVRELEMARLPWVYLAAGVGLLWLLGLGAAFGPAWRAAQIPPAIATRSA